MRTLNAFLMRGVSKVLPQSIMDTALRALAVPYGRSSSALEQTKENLRFALAPSKPSEAELERIARENMKNFASALCDLCYVGRLSDEFLERDVEKRGIERLEAARNKKRGVILATAHVGNWEMGGMTAARLGYPLTAVALAHPQKSVDAAFQEKRRLNGVRVAPLGHSLRACVNALKKNEVLAMVGDILFGEEGLEVNFFGKKAKLPNGIARFSLATGAPVVPAFFMMAGRRPRHYIFEIGEPLKGDTEQSLTQAFVGEVEDVIRRYPAQWFNFKKFWEPVSWPR